MTKAPYKSEGCWFINQDNETYRRKCAPGDTPWTGESNPGFGKSKRDEPVPESHKFKYIIPVSLFQAFSASVGIRQAYTISGTIPKSKRLTLTDRHKLGWMLWLQPRRLGSKGPMPQGLGLAPQGPRAAIPIRVPGQSPIRERRLLVPEPRQAEIST